MRLLLALAAALALTGCQVNLEGAACSVPGKSDQCPSGQSCGVDQRCSSSPVMTCPAPVGGQLVVDPGAPAGAPVPTGARSPPACRFQNLAQALAAAAQGAGTVVLASGAATSGGATTYPVVATLAIPAGVTLQGDDDPPAPANRVLLLKESLAAGVTLAEGATLSGFTVQNDSAAATAVGIEIACAAGNQARLTDVIVNAAGATSSLVNGVHAAGACPVVLTRVKVQGASGAGLLVARDGADPLFATDVALDSNGKGLTITRGDVTLENLEVKSNSATGVEVQGDQQQSSPYTKYALLTIDQGSSIQGNGDTGIVVVNAGRLRLIGTKMCGNGATTARGDPYAQRKVGGLYLFGNAPPDLAVQASTIFSNAGDQVLVAGSGTWALDGAAPGSAACVPSLIGNYAPPETGITYVGLYAASAAVTARWNAWGSGQWLGQATPLAGVDYASGGTPVTGSVDAGTPSQFCLWTAAAPTCD